MRPSVCVIGLRGLPSVIGGIEAHCQRLYPRLGRMAGGWRISLLIRPGYADRSRFAFEGLDVRTVWSPRGQGIDTVIHTLFALVYARLVLHPTVIHLHGIGPGFFAPLSRMLGFLTIVTHHAQDYQRPKWRWEGRLFLRLGEWATANAAHAVVCVSRSLGARFLEAYPEAGKRTCIIPNAGGLDDADYQGTPFVLSDLGLEPRSYVLAVGRLDQTKAFEVLIEAFERAGRDDLKLVIVGAGDHDYARTLRIQAGHQVVFAGFRTGDALRRLYEEALVFVHPSRMEGYGLVVAEALSVGASVLLSDIPPHREFGLRDDCYFAVDDAHGLAALIAKSAPDLYLSPEAVQAQREDDWERVAREHLALMIRVSPKLGRMQTAHAFQSIGSVDAGGDDTRLMTKDADTRRKASIAN